MPMETARGIIQIESSKNYYWRATRSEPAHSAGSRLRIRRGKEESVGRVRESEREREVEWRERERSREGGECGEGALEAGETVGEVTAGREEDEVILEVARVEGTTSSSRPRRVIRCSIAR